MCESAGGTHAYITRSHDWLTGLSYKGHFQAWITSVNHLISAWCYYLWQQLKDGTLCQILSYRVRLLLKNSINSSIEFYRACGFSKLWLHFIAIKVNSKLKRIYFGTIFWTQNAWHYRQSRLRERLRWTSFPGSLPPSSGVGTERRWTLETRLVCARVMRVNLDSKDGRIRCKFIRRAQFL